MKTAEEYFWENLYDHNLTKEDVIDRNKVNFDEIIILMESYAKEHAIDFAQHTWNPLGGLNKAEQIYTEWINQQTK